MALYNISFYINSTKYNQQVLLKKDSDKPQYFTFPEIDKITSECTGPEVFYKKYINANRQYGLIGNAWLTKKTNEKIRRKLIYNDAFVFEISSLVLEQKSSKLDYNVMAEYIAYIKKLALDKDCIESMLNSFYIPQKLRIELENYHRLKNMADISSTLFDDLIEVEREIAENLCNYSTFRQMVVWQKEFISTLGIEERDEYIYKAPSISLEEDEVEIEPEKNEECLEEGTEDRISNSTLRQYYIEYDGDIDAIVPILGGDFMDNLSEEDQKLVGYDIYKKRRVL